MATIPKNNKERCKLYNSSPEIKEKYRAKRLTPKWRMAHNKYRRGEEIRDPARFMVKNARKRAKDKNIECTITKEDIFIPEKCPIYLSPLRTGIKSFLTSPSLDRVDNSKGYTPENVRVISRKANNLKSNADIPTIERLLAYMKGEI